MYKLYKENVEHINKMAGTEYDEMYMVDDETAELVDGYVGLVRKGNVWYAITLPVCYGEEPLEFDNFVDALAVLRSEGFDI